MPARTLPARPDLKQLKHEAKDLLRAFRRRDPSAIADFVEYHPKRVDASTAQLADAQLVLARSYAAISWPRLVAAVDAIDAVTLEDFDKLRVLAAKHPEVLIDGTDRAGWSDPMPAAATIAPLHGATLLHMAVAYEELRVACWLIDHGADVNARATIDEDGFGGQTPLFNCVVGYNAGRLEEPLGRLLLDRGADPNGRASIRKRLPFARDTRVHEYKNVTPLGWGHAFHDQSYVSQAAMRLIAERGGTE